MAAEELDPIRKELEESFTSLRLASEETRGKLDEKMRSTVKMFLQEVRIIRGKPFEAPTLDSGSVLLETIGSLAEKMFKLDPDWRDPEGKKAEVRLTHHINAVNYEAKMMELVPSDNILEFLKYALFNSAEETIRRYEPIKGWAESENYLGEPTGFKAPIKIKKIKNIYF